MPVTDLPSGRQHRLPKSPPPAAAVVDLPGHRRRISDLLVAGHSVEHVIDIGRYQGTWSPGDVAAVVRSRGLPPPPARLVPLRAAAITSVTLTPRQVDVLRLMAMALDNAQIGKRLGITENTVKCHVGEVLRKMHARDRLHAVVLHLTGAVNVDLAPPT